MPKQASNAEINTFVQGLITEASPLNFPPNASLDEENFELNKKGYRSRRLGMDYEPDRVFRTSNLTVDELSTTQPIIYRWIQPGGFTDKNILVIQEKNVLSFFDLDVDSISSDGFISTLTLSEYPADNIRYSIDSVDGRLVVAAGYTKFAVVTYTGTAFTVQYLSLKVRDLWGVAEDGLSNYENDPSYRGATLYPIHIYNLQNQSWGIPRKNKSGTLSDPITLYRNDLLVYPSNSETVWPGLQYQPVSSGQDPFERVYTNLYTEVIGANTVAAKGYFIIDALNRGASRMEQFSTNYSKYPQLTYPSVTLPQDRTEGGASIVCEFAGRMFYAGFSGQLTDGDSRSPSLDGYVLFSQLIKGSNDYNKCYQDGDPTSRENSDVVDTDGGFIRLSGIKGILAMVNLTTHLVVIASNGVWTISGGSDYGFSASNYKVDKISSYGALASASIAEDGGNAYFWAEEGIYIIQKSEDGFLSVKNITQNTIESYYQTIPNDAKLNVNSIYDTINRKIKWVYSTGKRFTSDSETIELILDLNLGAFYKNRINRSPNNLNEVVALFDSPKFKIQVSENAVFSVTDQVISDIENVVIDSVKRVTGLQTIRYIVYVLDGGVLKYTVCYYRNPDFIDWQEDAGGVDAKAFLITGDQTAGDSSKEKQIPYLVIHFERTETGVTVEGDIIGESSCLVRSQWDWSNESLSNKWSQLREAYRYKRPILTDETLTFSNGEKLITTKNKLRGRGKSFALYMETSPLKDCIILGWNLTINGNALS